jgi:molybdopterin synthase sulfur carrier subunit
MIKVLFFAQLRESLGCNELAIDLASDQRFNSVTTLEQLREALAKTDENWQLSLANGKLLMAVNQTIVDGSQAVKDGDEVAFFPPVTGG